MKKITKNKVDQRLLTWKMVTLFMVMLFLGVQSATAQYTAIPDPNFEQALFDQGIDDVNGDGQVLTSAVSGLTQLYLSNSNISDLTGIEAFTNLKFLQCDTNEIFYLNVSSLINLEYLDCSNNNMGNMSFLNVNGLTKLIYLICYNNSLIDLNLAGLTNLKFLDCSYNQLQSIDVSGLINLVELDCSYNMIFSLSVNGLNSLQGLHCSFNYISDIELSYLNNLRILDCSYNELLSLSIDGLSGLNNLQLIDCSNNQLSSLNLNNLNNLGILYCSNNQLSSLNLSGLIILQELVCNYNQLSSLNLSGLNNLWTLVCDNNQFSSLNLSDLTRLANLDCSYNQLTSLVASTSNNLRLFRCNNNQLISLIINNMFNLDYLDCRFNQNLSCITVFNPAQADANNNWHKDTTASYATNCNLQQYTAIPDPNFEHALFTLGIDAIDGDHLVLTSSISGLTSLDVSSKNISNLTGIEAFTSLQTLNCSFNQIQVLNVNSLTNLQTLQCYSNQLTSLNLSGLTNLQTLQCMANQLTALNVSGLTNLSYFDCNTNQLSSLNVSGLTSLLNLDCRYNQLTSLNVSGLNNNNFMFLSCSYNQLTSLNLSGYTNLLTVYCNNNQLTKLNISNLPNLTYLFCDNNPTLSCITVSNPIVAATNSNWHKDNIASYATNCNPAPLAASSQTFCQGATVSNLMATGSSLKWYNVASGGSALAGTVPLVMGAYYVSQIINGEESLRAIVNVIINTNLVPTFTPVMPICSSSNIAALPSTSTNGIVGTWSPALNNTATTTYTFTPSSGQCATIAGLTIVVNPIQTPTFTSVSPICSGSNISALPSTSTNGIVGTWSPSLNNTATTTYTFAPNNGQCATIASLTIVINPKQIPTFTSISPICSGSKLSALPTTSTNGIIGTWSPALNNTATTTYTFTPNTGQCVATTTLTIVVNPKQIPTFSSVSPICFGETLSALPLTSNNSISGTWSPALNNKASTIYKFTPTAGQCATIANLTINVNNLPDSPGTISGSASQSALIGTTGTAIYSIAAVVGATSYFWFVPTGVNIVSGQGTTSILVNFNNVTSGGGTIGNISVQSVNASGCKSAIKTLSITKVLPVAPSSLVMTNGINNLPITSFAKYMGTTTVMKINAAPVATASSYDWELPTGVNRTDGTGTNSTTPYIYVNFSGVTSANTLTGASTNVLRIGVKSRNGVGASTTSNSGLSNPTTTSTAKLLTLTAVKPAAVSGVAGQIAGLCGGSTYSYTITDTALASSYSVAAPAGAVVIFTSNLTFTVTYPVGFLINASTSVANKSLVITSVNGIGSSVATKTLTLSTAMAAIAAVTGGTTYSSCNQTFSVAAIAGAISYSWTVPAGATIVSGQTTNSVVVNYGSLTGNQTIKVMATNGCGVSSAVKSVALTSGVCFSSKESDIVRNGTIEIKLYPNPTSNILYIEASNNAAIDKVVVMDLLGKEILEIEPESNQINVEQFISGTYIIQVYSNQEKLVQKFIKQ